MKFRFTIPFLCFILLNGCANYKAQYTSEVKKWEAEKPDPALQLKHRMYLLGDIGEAKPGEDLPVLLHVKKQLEQEGDQSSVLFLGNNVPEYGYPGKRNSKKHKAAESILDQQMDMVDNFKGRTFFVPGNNDWSSRLKGLRRQEKYIEKNLNAGLDDEDENWKNYLHPDRGCPGPEVIEINDQLVVLLIDSQWWLADWDKEPKIHDGCEIKSKFMFKFEFENLVRKYRSKNVVIAMHHPMYTNGPHSGNFTWKTHLFPLTEAKKNLWIPLPGIGTLYAFWRGRIGTRQDIANQEYKNLRDEILTAVKKNGSYIFVSGHDNSLQYLQNEFQHWIVSGSAARIDPSTLSRGARFAYGALGYSTIDFYDDGQAWLQFWVVNKSGEAKLVYREKIKDKLSINKENIPDSFPEYDEKKDTVVLLPTRNNIKKTGFVHKVVLGEHYRPLYLEKYKWPVLDLATYRGGLRPIKRGGGNQTNSLRLVDPDGHQFVLRDLTKDVTRLLPFPFNKMNAAEFVATDNFLSSHPFAPTALPPMADAINIYHTNPRFVYVPKQPTLGINNDIFGGSVYLFEERPGGSWKGENVFGGSEKLISTDDVALKITKNHKHEVDQNWTLRTRLFDMVIGDWDRHDDQWRWARFEEDGEKLYRPVPRDRDQAFSKYDGLVTRLVTYSLPFLHQLAVYSPKIRQIKWANWSPRSFDNSFLNELTWEDWEKEIKFIQTNLTDDIVAKAFEVWPEAPKKQTGQYIKNTLKARRDNLHKIARRYYNFLCKEVDVVGTEKDELFLVERLNNEDTRVRVFELKKGKKGDKVYDRTFQRSVTKEIRLYGIGDDDEFKLSGKAKKGIKVRCVGGLGEDTFIDESKVSGLSKKTLVYDDFRKNNIQLGTEGKDKRSNLAIDNVYNRRAAHYDYNYLLPIPILGSNPDDGFTLGLMGLYTEYGYNKDPLKATHKILASYSFATESFLLDYTGDWLDVFGKWDFYLSGLVKNPSYSFNYFGFGNDSPRGEQGIDFYRTRQGMIRLYPAIKKRTHGDNGFFTFGPLFEFSEIDEIDGRYLAGAGSDAPTTVFEEKLFAGAEFGFFFYNVDDIVIPHRGINVEATFNWQNNLKDIDLQFSALRLSLAIYQNLDRKQNVVFATRVGFGTNFGDSYEFWQAPNLGGETGMRGYRSERFYGETVFTQSFDLRSRLFSSYNGALPFTFGIYGGFDYGRVWEENDTSDTWHYDYGGGIWLAPLDAFTFTFGFFVPRNTLANEDKFRFAFTGGFNF